jgi:hypothetical protein
MSGFDTLISHMGDEWRLVTHGPVLFIVSVLIVGSLAYGIARGQYEARMATLKERLDFKDDQVKEYKDKLSGATPDEAKARFDALERRVTQIGGRRLTRDQRDRLMHSVIGAGAGAFISIAYAMSQGDCGAYATDFARTFSDAGWDVENVATMGLESESFRGTSVVVTNATALQPLESTVLNALRNAEIQFDLEEGGAPQPSSAGIPSVRMRITSPDGD